MVVDGPRRDRYPVAGRLPVRIATTHGVRYDRSEAVFVVIQYDSHGRRLARTRLAAHLAG